MIKLIVLIVSFKLFQSQALILPSDEAGRIINGSQSYAGQYPFVVAILKDTGSGIYFCAGTLIYNLWVLTAGQCVIDAVLFTIRLGTHSLSGDDVTALTLATEHYVLHPGFNPNTLVDDIGLIRFREPVRLTDYIRTINFISEPDPQQVHIAVGWGHTADDAITIEDILRWVALVPLSTEACKITYGDQFTDNMMCAGGNFHEGICRGDIGGPLFRSGFGMQYLEGIASFFSWRGCETHDPSGFTRIYNYVTWIQNVTSKCYY